MAIPWPEQLTRPIPFREHATRLSTYLQDALTCIDRTSGQANPADLVNAIIHGTLTFIARVQHAPDLSTVCDALHLVQSETKTLSENTAQTLDAVEHELRNTTASICGMFTNLQQNIHAREEARAAAKEAVQVGKVSLEMTSQIKNTGP